MANGSRALNKTQRKQAVSRKPTKKTIYYLKGKL
jgi:hypothetical protein